MRRLHRAGKTLCFNLFYRSEGRARPAERRARLNTANTQILHCSMFAPILEGFSQRRVCSRFGRRAGRHVQEELRHQDDYCEPSGEGLPLAGRRPARAGLPFLRCPPACRPALLRIALAHGVPACAEQQHAAVVWLATAEGGVSSFPGRGREFDPASVPPIFLALEIDCRRMDRRRRPASGHFKSRWRLLLLRHDAAGNAARAAAILRLVAVVVAAFMDDKGAPTDIGEFQPRGGHGLADSSVGRIEQG